MKITTDHPSSSYGHPVILGDDGQPMDYSDGIKAVRKHLGLSVAQLAKICGISARTVEGWEQGRSPTAAALNVMSDLMCISAAGIDPHYWKTVDTLAESGN